MAAILRGNGAGPSRVADIFQMAQSIVVVDGTHKRQEPG